MVNVDKDQAINEAIDRVPRIGGEALAVKSQDFAAG
jgi:hypothetical protein